MSIFDQIKSAFASDFVSGTTVNPQYQPPQRTWVGLTDKEIEQLHTVWVLDGSFRIRKLCNSIEAKLKEKNFD